MPCLLDDDRVSNQTSFSQASTVSCSPQNLERVISNYSSEFSGQPKKKRCIMSPYIASVLDRTKTTSRAATFIIAAVAVELGYDINEISLSHSTVHRARENFRSQMAAELKNNLQVSEYLVVHWDGKLLPDLLQTDQVVDRLPVIISGVRTEQLLGVPKMESGTGANQAEAILEALRDWEVTDRVKGMCFDTTTSNTGKFRFLIDLISSYVEEYIRKTKEIPPRSVLTRPTLI